MEDGVEGVVGRDKPAAGREEEQEEEEEDEESCRCLGAAVPSTPDRASVRSTN